MQSSKSKANLQWCFFILDVLSECCTKWTGLRKIHEKLIQFTIILLVIIVFASIHDPWFSIYSHILHTHSIHIPQHHNSCDIFFIWFIRCSQSFFFVRLFCTFYWHKDMFIACFRSCVDFDSFGHGLFFLLELIVSNLLNTKFKYNWMWCFVIIS